MELSSFIRFSIPRLCAAGIICLIAAGCGTGVKKPGKEEQSPFGPSGVPPFLRPKGAEGTAILPGGNVDPAKLAAAITPEEDILFTDADNPDKGLPELDALLSAPKKGPWEEDEAIALRKASREGKPLLIWFTDDKSAPSKALSEELFSRTDFGEWADQHLVRLRIGGGQAIQMESLNAQQEARNEQSNSITRLKKKYKVLGSPSLLLLNPTGEVIGRYRGYKRGDADFTWGLIKQGEIASSTTYGPWRKGLEKKGYREWQDTRGRKVFAKLLSYQKGTLVLIEPDGFRSQTREERLSSQDKEWIKQQKMLRGIQ